MLIHGTYAASGGECHPKGFKAHHAAVLAEASGREPVLEALERLSEQAGSRWMISLDEGCRSREEIVRRRRDPGIALDQIQQVQEMGLEVVQPGLRMVRLLKLGERVLN